MADLWWDFLSRARSMGDTVSKTSEAYLKPRTMDYNSLKSLFEPFASVPRIKQLLEEEFPGSTTSDTTTQQAHVHYPSFQERQAKREREKFLNSRPEQFEMDLRKGQWVDLRRKYQ